MELTNNQAMRICEKLNEDFVSVNLLPDGAHNDAYLLETQNSSCIVKVELNAGYVEKEYHLLKSLKKGLGPQVYLFDKSKQIIQEPYLVEEFLSGKHPSKKPSDEFVILMAKWFKKLHSIRTCKIPSKEKKLIYSLHHWCNQEGYVTYSRCKKDLPDKLVKEIEPAFQRALAICEEHDGIFKRRNSFPLVHNDCWRSNVFVDGNKVRLIDWEFAGYGLQERDLSIFLNEYTVNNRQKQLFLETYGYKLTNVKIKQLSSMDVIMTAGNIAYLAKKISSSKSNQKKETLERLEQILNRFNKILTSFN